VVAEDAHSCSVDGPRLRLLREVDRRWSIVTFITWHQSARMDITENFKPNCSGAAPTPDFGREWQHRNSHLCALSQRDEDPQRYKHADVEYSERTEGIKGKDRLRPYLVH
jgi:hypothetical protein